jgi:hypothetical protein
MANPADDHAPDGQLRSLATLRWDRQSTPRSALLHPPPLEETGVGGVLFDVRSVTLLRSILNVIVSFRGIPAHLGVVSRPFIAAIGGRYWGHLIVA